MKTLNLPVNQAEVQPRIREFAAEIQKLNVQVKVYQQYIEILRDMCIHPRTETGNTWGRWSWTRCLECGKEW